MADRASPKGLWAVKLTRELWKRQIWTDSKAVEIMKEASSAENAKVSVGGVRFFLGGDKEREELEDESSDEEEIDMGKIKHQVGINKKTKKKSKQLDKAVAQIKKVYTVSASTPRQKLTTRLAERTQKRSTTSSQLFSSSSPQ